MAGIESAVTLGRRASVPVPRPRLCARPGCDAEAFATMTYDYRARRAWIDGLDEEQSPAGYDLCAGHADRLGVPNGWTRTDRRPPADAPFTRLAV